MKKKLIALTVIVVAAGGYIAASWYTGNIIERRIDDEIIELTNNINQDWNMRDLSVDYQDYQKGIFSTTFHLTVELSGVGRVFDDVITIEHGPFPWSRLKSGELSPKIAYVSYQTSKEYNESLWKAAGNKPFLTINSSVDYNKNFTVDIRNESASYFDKEQEFSFSITPSHFSVTSMDNLNKIDVSGHVEQFIYQDLFDEMAILIKNMDFLDTFKNGNDSTHHINIDTFNQYELISEDIENLSLETASLSLNQLIMDAHLLMEKTEKIDGNFSASVGDLYLVNQHIGKGRINGDFSVPNARNDDQDVHSLINLNEFLWQTEKGDLTANFSFDAIGDALYTYDFTEDNLNFVEAKLNFPLEVLSTLAAKLRYPEKEIISESDILEATQTIDFFFKLFFYDFPLIRANFDPEDGIEDGIFMDFYYSKEENRAKLHDEDLTLDEFWLKIVKAAQE